MRKEWTTGEEEMLEYLLNVEKLSHKEIAVALNRSWYSITQKAKRKKLKHHSRWCKIEPKLKKLIFNTTLNHEEIAFELGKTERALKERLHLLFGTQNLTKIRNIKVGLLQKQNKSFTEKEIEYIKENYYVISPFKVAKNLKRSKKSLYKKVCEIKNNVKFKNGFYTHGWSFREYHRMKFENRDL